GEHTTPATAPWNLGRFGILLNAVAVLWVACISILFSIPPNELAGWSMILLGGFMALYWLLAARHHFPGPPSCPGPPVRPVLPPRLRRPRHAGCTVTERHTLAPAPRRSLGATYDKPGPGLARSLRRRGRWGWLRSGSRDAIRTVEVLSPSAGDEEQWVFLTSM